MNDTQNAAIVAATNALTASLDTYITGTLAPLVASLDAARKAAEVTLPLTARADAQQQALYRAIANYVRSRTIQENEGQRPRVFSSLSFPL